MKIDSCIISKLKKIYLFWFSANLVFTFGETFRYASVLMSNEREQITKNMLKSDKDKILNTE